MSAKGTKSTKGTSYIVIILRKTPAPAQASPKKKLLLLPPFSFRFPSRATQYPVGPPRSGSTDPILAGSVRASTRGISHRNISRVIGIASVGPRGTALWIGGM